MDAKSWVGMVLQIFARANPDVEKISGNQHPIHILSSKRKIPLVDRCSIRWLEKIRTSVLISVGVTGEDYGKTIKEA
jgi:hypothetical protein